jgi:parallel beta-helix repeat protein
MKVAALRNWFGVARRCSPPTHRRLSVELLEDRTLLSTFIVTNTNDHGDGSLRRAINNANDRPGHDLIEFNIPGTGVQNIRLRTGLPIIADAMTIDGTTQPSAALGTPLIALDGATAESTRDVDGRVGLRLEAGNSTVRGLLISGFRGAGIELAVHGANRIEGNSIVGNSGDGIGVNQNSGDNFIVGNVVSGNGEGGISIASDRNLVEGNFVGTDHSGSVPLGNGWGVSIVGGSNNAIGGTTPAARNVISSNRTAGIGISPLSSFFSGEFRPANSQ